MLMVVLAPLRRRADDLLARLACCIVLCVVFPESAAHRESNCNLNHSAVHWEYGSAG